MKKRWTMLFFVISGFLYGQQTFLAKVDSLKMEIGDQQNLTLTFTTSLGGNSPDFHLENLDTCSFFERVGQTEWIKTQSSTSTIIEKKIRFSVFDDGYYKIPTLYAVLGNDSIATYEIPIEITGVEPDSTGLLPIKGIVKEKNNWQDYLWWYVLLIALGLVYIVYRYMQKRKNQKLEDIIVPVEIIKSPHQIALEKLGTLKESRIDVYKRQRQWNVSNNIKYCAAIEQGLPYFEGESLTAEMIYNETVMTHLRTMQGISLKNLKAEFRDHFVSKAKDLLSREDIKLEHGHYKLTKQGMFIADSISVELFI